MLIPRRGCGRSDSRGRERAMHGGGGVKGAMGLSSHHHHRVGRSSALYYAQYFSALATSGSHVVGLSAGREIFLIMQFTKHTEHLAHWSKVG